MERRGRRIREVAGEYAIASMIVLSFIFIASRSLKYEDGAELPLSQTPTTPPTPYLEPTSTQIPYLDGESGNLYNCEEYPEGVTHRDKVIYMGQEGLFQGQILYQTKSWQIQFYDTDGKPYTLTCEEINREDVFPKN